jgi:hypothetical protein
MYAESVKKQLLLRINEIRESGENTSYFFLIVSSRRLLISGIR